MTSDINEAIKLSEAFESFKKSTDYGCNIKHLHGCEYESWRNVPVSECQCDCYEFSYFKAGNKYQSGE